MTKQDEDKSTAPKRLLVLDGGGVRGILTLSYLARIEELVS
jgi:patatin-like phospholipase/acyl hydrolase